MEVEKRSFVDWIKEHKIELIIAGISITAIITVIVGLRNHQALEEIWEYLKRMVQKTPDCSISEGMLPPTEIELTQNTVEINTVSSGRISHEVVEHIRNLPEGWKASAMKMATAEAHGYELLPGQTWVQAYRTGGLAA